MSAFSTLYYMFFGLSFISAAFAQPSGGGGGEGGESSGGEGGESSGGESGGESGSGGGGSGGGGSSVDLSYVNSTLYSAYYGIASASDYSFTMDVALDCSRVFFTFTDVDGDYYSAWGIGGDYSGSGSSKMDGYCIVVQEGNTWETTLDGSSQPTEQSSQDLYCTQSVDNGDRTTSCRRSYDTGDTEDFDSYSFGTIEVIYADGDVDEDGAISQHANNGASETTMEVVGMGCQDLSNYSYYGGAFNGDYSMQFEIDYECTTVTFSFIDVPGLYYSAWGFGGDYTLNGANLMNGYAIIISSDYIWETTLDGGTDPVAQSSQDLDCTQSTIDGIRYTSCTRDYDTGDTDDWSDFSFYFQDFIYAFGDVTNSSGIMTPEQHGGRDAGVVTGYIMGEGCNGVGKPSTTLYPTSMPVTDNPTRSPVLPTPAPTEVTDSGNCVNCDSSANSLSLFVTCFACVMAAIFMYLN